MGHYEDRINNFKKEFPSIKWINRVVVDTGTFKAGDNVLSLADVERHTTDNQVIIDALNKLIDPEIKKLLKDLKFKLTIAKDIK